MPAQDKDNSGLNSEPGPDSDSGQNCRFTAEPFDVFNVFFERIYDPTMHLMVRYSGMMDEEILRRSVILTLGSVPFLSAKFVESENRCFWERTGPERYPDAFVFHKDCNPEEIPYKIPPKPLDVRSGPQIRVDLFRTEYPGSDLITVTCHHGAMDARGLVDISEYIFTVYRNLYDNSGFIPEIQSPDRSLSRIYDMYPDSVLKEALTEEEKITDTWNFPFLYHGRGERRMARRDFDHERLSEAKEVCRRYGGTVNDLLIAVFFLALCKVRDDPVDDNRKNAMLTSADLRRYIPDIENCSPANLSAAYEISAVTSRYFGIEDILPGIIAATKERKNSNLGLGSVLFYRNLYNEGIPRIKEFFDGMISTYRDSDLKNPVLSNIGVISGEKFSNIPGKNGTLLSPEDLCFLPVVCYPPGFLLTASTFNGVLSVFTGYESGPYDEADIDRFMEGFDDLFPGGLK
ncbi:hypothetical protein [Methanoplanus limicola]|uniref:Condensation domain-containing protein n=1 Tax=Methanoplanus limicola DSM 2279 TaxID=937775 RepID=H1Z2A4_9EURY|nr:hypothetical protein [Methanoplanus limicola]EHQ34633.1 condensation domain-containing protein [Methanoplanus limicola DSM 2279]